MASPPREKTPGKVLPGEVFEKATRPSCVGRAADRLAALAPANDCATARRYADAVIRLVGHQLVDAALDEIQPFAATPTSPARLLGLVASWLTDHDHPSAPQLEQLADTLDDHPDALTLADATARKTRRHWTDHVPEAGEVLDHWHRHQYPPSVVTSTLARARADGLRRPAHADRIAREELADLGHGRPRFVPAAPDRGTA